MTATIPLRAGRNTSSAATRIKIMETAERLFGDYGIDAVALRAISTEAGQGNTNSVQYHFGDRFGLLKEIFEYREAQLDVMRGWLLEMGREQHKLHDVRWLLRICFQPNFCHFVNNDGLPYIKLHAQYLAHVRPRGIPHPVDYECPSTLHFRQAIALLRNKLSFLSQEQFDMRLGSVGAMFLGAIVQHAGGSSHQPGETRQLFKIVLEMMTAAISVPPWDFSANG